MKRAWCNRHDHVTSSQPIRERQRPGYIIHNMWLMIQIPFDVAAPARFRCAEQEVIKCGTVVTLWRFYIFFSSLLNSSRHISITWHSTDVLSVSPARSSMRWNWQSFDRVLRVTVVGGVGTQALLSAGMRFLYAKRPSTLNSPTRLYLDAQASSLNTFCNFLIVENFHALVEWTANLFTLSYIPYTFELLNSEGLLIIIKDKHLMNIKNIDTNWLSNCKLRNIIYFLIVIAIECVWKCDIDGASLETTI